MAKEERFGKIERERSHFRALLAENPNYFGNLSDEEGAAGFAPVFPLANNTRYEQLRCVGLYPEDDLLEAVLEIKRTSGYSGGLCDEGSKEYVAFYIDWEDGNGFVSVGAPAQVKVHDLAASSDRDLFYAVRKPFTPQQRLKCQTPQVVRVRAILSWNAIPTGPGYNPVWGNVVTVWVQIKPKAKPVLVLPPVLVSAFDPPDLPELAPADDLPGPGPVVSEKLLLSGTKEEIKELVDFSLAEEQAIQQAGDLEPHRIEFKALVTENPNYFGSITKSDDSDDLFAAVAQLPQKTASYLAEQLTVDPGLLKPVKPFLKKTKYEELRCVGLYPEGDLLEAVIEVKRPTGYNGSLCSLGSKQYVAFYIDWGPGGYQYAATAEVGVHNIPEASEHHLFYAVKAKIPNPKIKPCTVENIVRVKAILSWNVDPTPFGPGYVPSWGNVMIRDVQIRPKDGASAKCDLEIVNEIHTDDIDANGLAIKVSGGVNVPGTFNRPFGGVIGCWGNVNVSGASYYRFWYKQEPAGAWTLVTDKRRARGFGGVTLFRTPDANGWFSKATYLADLANYDLAALVHWSSGSRNGEYRLKLELGDGAKNPLPNPCEVTLELDNVGPELLDFTGALLPTQGVAVKDAAGKFKKCETFVGPEPIRVFGNFRDNYFRKYDLTVFGGNLNVSGVGIGSGHYDDGFPLTTTGIFGAANPGLGQELLTFDLCSKTPKKKIRCAYGVRLRVWDRALVGGLSGYQFDTWSHGRTAFVTFDWDPQGC